MVQSIARQLEVQSRKLGEESEAKLRPHERLAMALTFIQIAVALATITVLTRRRWLLWGSVGAASGPAYWRPAAPSCCRRCQAGGTTPLQPGR